MLLAALLLAFAPTPAEIRMKAAEGYSDPYLIPGADLSDEAAQKAASGCGETQECLDRQINAREILRRLYSQWPTRRSAIRRAIRQNTVDGITDWHWALSFFRDTIPSRPRNSATCTTVARRRYATTTCSVY